MLFYEPLFLFAFFPVVFVLFLLFRRRANGRGAVLLLASIGFYAWSEPLFVPVAFLTCLADYALSFPIARGSRVSLIVGIVINLSMLVFYKYTDFAIANLDIVFGSVGLPFLRVIGVALPIGVSFIVFEKISYLVDVHRHASRPAPSLPAYLLYVFLFPKLLAGPIIKYHELDAQLRHVGHLSKDDVMVGLRRFMLGLVKKVLVADPLGRGADITFAVPSGQLGFADAWWGLLFFTFQIYVDFSAYSDMAIGLARIFGFTLRENFNFPYVSCSVTEFWRRWHISLSTWIREYLYYPLGGNRVSVSRRYANLWICFLLSGLWHGAAWNFVFWGAYNGLFLVLDRIFLLRWLDARPRWVANALTFLVIMLGWLAFRATNVDQATAILTAALSPGQVTTQDGYWRSDLMMTALTVSACISFLPRLPGYARMAERATLRPVSRALLDGGLSVLFVLSLAQSLAEPFRPFLYFRF